MNPDHAPPKRKRRHLDPGGVATSLRIAPDLLASVEADANERGVYKTTLVNFIIAKYYGDVAEMERAGCAQEGEIEEAKKIARRRRRT